MAHESKIKNILFTVITTTYNRAELLRQALKSIEFQTLPSDYYEAFIIDDGSTDNTPSVFKEFEHNKNWHFIRFKTNRRQAYCRNYAIKNSHGKYITFLDADDIWLPERLEKFAKFVLKNPDAGFIFSNGYIMQDGTITSKFFDETRDIPKGKLKPYMAISDKYLPYVTTNVAFPKHVIEKTGFFREDMSHLEDMELYVKILKFYEADYISEPLSIYRIHSLTKNPRSLTLKWEDGIKDFLIALETANPDETTKKQLKDYVYYKQAVVFLKNCLNLKSREYLLKTSKRNVKFYFIYTCSFLPRPVLFVLKIIYRLIRSIKCKLFTKSHYKTVQKFVDSFSKTL